MGRARRKGLSYPVLSGAGSRGIVSYRKRASRSFATHWSESVFMRWSPTPSALDPPDALFRQYPYTQPDGRFGQKEVERSCPGLILQEWKKCSDCATGRKEFFFFSKLLFHRPSGETSAYRPPDSGQSFRQPPSNGRLGLWLIVRMLFLCDGRLPVCFCIDGAKVL